MRFSNKKITKQIKNGTEATRKARSARLRFSLKFKPIQSLTVVKDCMGLGLRNRDNDKKIVSGNPQIISIGRTKNAKPKKRPANKLSIRYAKRFCVTKSSLWPVAESRELTAAVQGATIKK